jgi:lipopolysaccharide export system protein LptA
MRGIAVLAVLLAALAAAHAQNPPPPTTQQGDSFDLAHGGPVAITAAGGFTLDQTQQTATAYGDARAVRGDVTVVADRLIAHYRRKQGAQAAAAADDEGGGNEIYRLEAIGNVRIFTPTDTAVGDRAVYDMDQAVLVMTGGAMRITTPHDTLTARDTMEYWSDKHMAVARGNAVAIADDGRQVRADILVAYTKPSQPAGPSQPTSGQPPGQPLARPGSSVSDQAGSVEKVEAFGNVEIRTAEDVARGDRGIYLPPTGQARLVGHVRITRGENQLNGPAADVDMRTGIAHLIAAPNAPVSGLLMPQQQPGQPTGQAPATAPKAKAP